MSHSSATRCPVGLKQARSSEGKRGLVLLWTLCALYALEETDVKGP